MSRAAGSSPASVHIFARQKSTPRELGIALRGAIVFGGGRFPILMFVREFTPLMKDRRLVGGLRELCLAGRHDGGAMPDGSGGERGIRTPDTAFDRIPV